MSPPGRTVQQARAVRTSCRPSTNRCGDNALEAFISRLRKKLVGSGAAIRTLRGIGYLLEAESVSGGAAAPSLIATACCAACCCRWRLTWLVGTGVALVVAS